MGLDEEIKIENLEDTVPGVKGNIPVSDLNLANILIGKKYPLEPVVKYLLDEFVILNSFQN